MQNLAAGGVIAYPTEAVYGLGCDAFCESAVQRLLALKQRPWHKGLILVAADLQQIAPLISRLSEDQVDQLEASWPGPTTWVIPDPDGVIPYWIRGQHESVAVRVSSHPIVKQLCEAWGAPLVSTSANLSGETSIRTDLPLRKRQRRGQWADLDFIVSGRCSGHENPTVIRNLVSGKVLRSS
jgi:L-threonylcarbamoyladenylate synthase